MDEVSMSSNIEIKLTPSGLHVPVKNNIFLHSAYDPIKEADNFLEKHINSLTTKDNILVLGFGFGYHIDAIYNYCNQQNLSPNIFILEPDQELISKAEELRSIKYANLITFTNLTDLFNDIKFAALLITKPYFLPHPASIASNETYFKNFLTFQASQKTTDVTKYIQDISLSSTIAQLENTDEINKIFEMKNFLSKEDFLLCAFSEMKKQGRDL